MSLFRKLQEGGIVIEHAAHTLHAEDEHLENTRPIARILYNTENGSVLHLKGVYFQPWLAPDLEGLSRLSGRDNVDFEVVRAEADKEKWASKNLLHWMYAVRILFVRSVLLAADAIEQGSERVAECLSAQLYASTTPSFKNLGLLSHQVTEIAILSTDTPDQPAVDTIGVNALPGGALLKLDVDFLISG